MDDESRVLRVPVIRTYCPHPAAISLCELGNRVDHKTPDKRNGKIDLRPTLHLVLLFQRQSFTRCQLSQDFILHPLVVSLQPRRRLIPDLPATISNSPTGTCSRLFPQRNLCDKQKYVRNPLGIDVVSPVWDQDDPFVNDRSEFVGSHTVVFRQFPDQLNLSLCVPGFWGWILPGLNPSM